MDESEENMIAEDINNDDSPVSVKIKPKKRSLVERELETNLTARVTSPVTGEGSSTSRYGRARRIKTASEIDADKIMKPLKVDVSKQPQAYKMHASNSPINKESPKRTISVGSSIEDQIENIYNENISLSRFGSVEKTKSQSPAKKFSKIYIRKDLIQKPDTDTAVLIKNMFSPNKSNSHLNNILERSSEKYSLNGHGKAMNGFPDTSSVVKTLDFDGKKKNKQVSPAQPIKKEVKEKITKELKEKVIFKDIKEKLVSKEVKEKLVSKNELFELEATCEYQVGDLAWARVGTYPFWPCIVTREPFSDMFVKKKLFGRVERSVIHVTFFGDNGRRGWIVDNMLRKFHGRAEFEACRNKFTPESKKKDPRLYAAHFVSEKKLPLWNVSVEEAETLMKEPKRLRIDALYDMLEKARAAKTTPSKRDKGGKITRTDSDVSLSESLYDTLFSEDDGKQDDNRSKRARNKSLDVSEVVTACLDNMAARSGIIQIQRQSHMDRWLQKAKSKTPEKMQPKLHIKVEREKRKDKAKKKKEGKNTHKTRKNESLGSDTNLLPYQNEHDYSSVNYENHDINDSSNKNIDSASGLDSTLDTSTTISDVGVTVKIENISSSMEDCSQEDIITSIVNDDIVMTDSVNISKDETRNNVTNRKDNINNKIKNNNEHILDTGNKNNNELVEIKEELPLKNCDLTNTIHPRRSKRKRQTFEGINNSITEKKAKEPKLDLHNQKPNEETTTPKNALKSNNNQESKLDESKETEDSEKTEMANNEPTIENVDKETSLNIKIESTDSFPDQSKLPDEPLNSSANIAQFESSYQEPEPQLNSDVLTVETAFAHAESEKCVKEACSDTITNDRDISTIRRSRRSKEKHDAKKTKKDLKEKNNEVESTDRMASDSIPRSVVDNISLNTDTDNNIPTENIFEKETSLSNSAESNELISSVESHKEAYAESDKCVKGTCSTTITNDRDISTIRRSRRSKEKHDAKKTKNDSKENNKVESTDRMACDSIPKSVVDNVPLNSDNTDVFEKEASLNSSAESTELISCVSNISKPVVDIKPLNSENAVTVSNETPTITLEKETSQDTRVESKEISSNKPKDEIKNKPLSSEITVTESNVSTVKNIEEETSKNRKLESTEPMPCNSKSKPVVVIEPLNFVNTILESNTATEETSKNSKPEARELTLFNNKSRPVVVIEPLNCENIVECNPPIIANLEKETSPNNKFESMELIAFHKSSKPVVVIEPLDMQGLETQFIIKGSTPLVRNRSVDSLNKKDNIEDKSETTSVLSDLVQNDVCNALKDNDNTTEVSSAVDELENVNTKPETDTASSSQYTYAKPKKTHDVLKNRHEETKISFDDSERMEGDDCTTHVVDEDPGVTTSSIPRTELAETVFDPSPSIEIKTIEVPIQPVIKKDDEILKNNVQTNVVIGEETYIFDRTLSQDYDEIDGDCYDEYSHLPQVIINEETEKAILIQNTLISNQKNSSQESCTDKINNSTEKISSLSNDSGPEIVKNDSQIQGNCIFLDKRNIHNDSEIVEDHEVPTGDVSSIAKEENNCNEVTQDNNDKCVFLDQRSKTADAQSADNIEKKIKSSRFSLNRTRNRSLKLNKVNTVLESSEISIAKVNTESGHLKPASFISNEDEMLISSKRRKSDPEFVKYMVIRQDTLLDEQPDLTQDEIVTYLYKNWLYEEENKSDMKKMDDNEQASLVKGFQKSQQPKKVKKKPKLGNVAELKNVDIRKMLNKGKTKSFPDQSELASEPLYNSEHNIASCEGSYQEPEPHRNNVIQTVESNKNPQTEPQKNVKKASSVKEVSIANDNVLSTIRHSRRSEDKRDTKTALNELKEKLEDNCVVKIASINITDSKVSTTRTRCLRLSKDKLNINPILNTSPEKCFIETTQTSSNDIGIPCTNRPDELKQKEDTKRAMDDPEFMKYLEIHQDNLLDEQPDLTQDELYNKSKQLNLVNNQNSENNKHLGLIKDELDIVQITDSEKNVLEMASPNHSEISIIKAEKNAKETISTEPEISQMNSNDSLMSTKPTGRTKEKQDTKKAINDPEFIKYLEMHQDALLDEQPDLTQDEIVNYLYQNWLYEEGNKSEMKKIDDNEQSNLVKGLNHFPVPPLKKIKKKSKVEKAPESKNADIRCMLHKEISKSASVDIEISSEKGAKEININNLPEHRKTSCGKIENGTHESNVQNIDKLNNIVDSDSLGRVEALTLKENTSDQNSDKILKNFKDDSSENLNNRTEEAKKISEDIDDIEFGLDELEGKDNEDSKESAHCKIINGFIDFEESSKSKTNEGFDPETASIKSEDSSVSATTRKARKEKDAKKSMDDPDFLKYLEARQDALIDEQPDLTREEIVTYLYQTWFYEESTKSDMKKSDETEQSNLVKGLNQEPPPEPKKIKKRPKVEKESVEKVKSTEVKDIKVEKSGKVLKNADIRDMIQKPKRKATQSKPYYNEDDSDLEEEDLETFKIFDRDEPTEDGEEIDEVELYFEQLTKPKPNVFKGYVRERVCEICYRAGNLVKCKSCHGTYHVECVKKEAEVTEVAGPTRGRKRKRGRKPKGYDPSLDTGSQSDERSQDANNSEEINISIEDEAESHIVFDEENFETLWENKMKELQTDTQDDYVSDQEIDWEVEPGHCEIVDLKHKEKPIDYSDYKCNNCLKYETPVCFVCKSNKSPKALTEVRQKCQVAHCHRYYHLECLDHWPQTQFNSWEPSKTNKKQIEYIEALSCPRHVCHTCVSDDPRGCKTRFCGDKLARCVKCPATYHSYTKCLPAGSQILTGSQIICPRHYEHRPGKVPCHVNTGWCFICALGGTLICCEYCPTSFHAECLNIKPPEGSYMCEDCETGRLPLYGEMVWVKLGHYRWWPGIVLHPTEIPDNILAVKHSQGEFVVRFFGQYDHYWVNRGRVFPFQEGDSGRISSQKSKIDAAFTTAMEHAQRACEILKKMEPNEEEDLDIASSLLPPHYVKLKVNKPAGNVVRRDVDANSLTQCDCDPNQPDPCGLYSHCLNRMLLTECGPLCRAGERCHNRAFERRQYPRLQAYRTPHRGWGLRTLQDIKQGQFVIEYVGELIDMEEFRRRMCRKHEIRDENFYFLTLDKERMIDAGPKGNLARFMNHCCEPNCETQKWTVLGDVRVGLFALYDIPANTEVTFNYNLECAGIEKKRCLCGAKRCSGYIGAKPKQLQEDKPKLPKRTYKKRKPVEETKPKLPKIKIKPIKPRELTEIEKDLLIIKNATNGMSSDSEGSRLSVDDKNPKALKRKRVSFSTDELSGKKAKLESEVDAV